MVSNVVVGTRLGAEKLEVEEEDMSVIAVVLIIVMVIRQ
jgi:hypothetical protein